MTSHETLGIPAIEPTTSRISFRHLHSIQIPRDIDEMRFQVCFLSELFFCVAHKVLFIERALLNSDRCLQAREEIGSTVIPAWAVLDLELVFCEEVQPSGQPPMDIFLLKGVL